MFTIINGWIDGEFGVDEPAAHSIYEAKAGFRISRVTTKPEGDPIAELLKISHMGRAVK